jgi:hypothetical protein
MMIGPSDEEFSFMTNDSLWFSSTLRIILRLSYYLSIKLILITELRTTLRKV